VTVSSHFSPRGFSNTFLVASEGEALVVDPGTFDRHLLLHIEDNGLRVRSVLLTHWHRSHTDGIRTMSRIYEFSVFSYYPGTSECRCIEVRDGERIPCGAVEAVCLETPGHSEDSVCYRIGDCIFTGDTLMAGEIGSTSGAAQRQQLIASVWSKILCGNEDVLVFPGHGPPTKVGIEKQFNPRLTCGE
jgi:glyoxylase-like metal-dependent hydrolase (beta-lactamase superfamily II)